ncbi:receptor-like protein EIX2 [Prosopis cineraria]|uniref:receptor-like protein EIX2 n=1 Tax=Prosopis cineraria TaxID=364024 RepID=UPI0024100D21|nr:receptor-like protein EIX2 [Prosopis cineraria]
MNVRFLVLVSIVLLLLLSGTCAVGGNVYVRCIEKERLSLLSLKQGFIDRYGNLSSWGYGENQKECCNWTGVHCDSLTGHVVGLDLSFCELEGPLPDFSQLLSLQRLYLDHNQLNGTLDDSIGLLSSLTELSIKHNSLEGVISENHFLRLSQLFVLDFSFNHFIFQISPDWVPPFRLAYILLASCKLGPDFPMWLQTQTSCVDLDISSAEISGTIPSWFWNLPFKLLNISHNQFTGEIPDFQFSYAFHMDFSSNLFEGSIPSTLSYIKITLYLSNNKFTDASSILCPKMTTLLHVLDLSNNQLFGTLPDCWTHFESLVVLNVANNSLFGKLPTSMGSLRNLQALHLGYNRFTGELPSFLNGCTELTTFDIVQNNFSGSIPSWIGSEFQKLRVLILRSNMFSGTLPSTICHLFQVQILDLSVNNISGSLPKCLNHLSALANRTNSDATIIYYLPFSIYDRDSIFVVDIASLIWKGRESKYQNILGLVKSIDVSRNMLTGEIPSELMDLVGLVSLNISANMISGQIPTAIGQLKSLDFLDLSRNHLFGRIPSELSQIDRLSVMNLSYNNLSGEIPIGTQLQSFDPSAYVGNVGLCGAPLPKCPKKPTQDNQDDGNSKDDEQFFNQGFYISLSLGFSTGFSGVCSLLILNKSWRYAYFKLMNDAYDKVYVVVAINMAKLRRWNARFST